MRRLAALLGLLLPLALAGCLLVPGKFTSTLDIDADRSFVFTYVGEVAAIDVAKAMGEEPGEGLPAEDGDEDDGSGAGVDEDAAVQRIAFQKEAAPAHDHRARADTRNRAIAAALAREAGYRKVEYIGDDTFAIDYRIAGTLDRGFVWPYNLDAEMVLPFVAIETRGDGTVRVKAPGFANEGKATVPGADDAAALLDGTFTLSTDAEIVAHNNEGGATAAANGRRQIAWKATPTTRAAPMAVLRMAR
ncbi:hypothetical protein [Sphingomonas aracearum]|uniref:Uncharacterized protein n=1 Tax=Sphingomonas aracearum TaxID=2283317 RepID=A0A369VVG1_9SPHN|nr:hypothetical protein [Sphingomonas aracearum]RDE05839.1 hypothetical protein DVW87_11650 [Sphingomonas aracearum]